MGLQKSMQDSQIYYEVYLYDSTGSPLQGLLISIVAKNINESYTVGLGGAITDYQGHCLVEVFYPEPGLYNVSIEIISRDYIWMERPFILVNVVSYGGNISLPNITLYDIYLELVKTREAMENIIVLYTSMRENMSLILDNVLGLYSYIDSRIEELNNTLSLLIVDSTREIITYINSSTHRLEVLINNTLSYEEAIELISMVLDRLDSLNATIVSARDEVLAIIESVNTSIMAKINTSIEDIEAILDNMFKDILAGIDNKTSIIVSKIQASRESIESLVGEKN